MMKKCLFHLFEQSLRLSQAALGETSPGKIVNLLSNDVSRFELLSLCLNGMWLSPLITIVIAGLLWNDIGFAGLIGIAIIFIVVTIQSKSIFCIKLGKKKVNSIQNLRLNFRLYWKINVKIPIENSLAHR